jgi:hypothetical protein
MSSELEGCNRDVSMAKHGVPGFRGDLALLGIKSGSCVNAS